MIIEALQPPYCKTPVIGSPLDSLVSEVYNMDCIDGMKHYPDKYFDLAICDPPYGLERFKKGGSHINKYGSENGQWNNKKPTLEYFTELFRVSKNCIIWGGNNFDLPTSEYFIIWQKSNAEDFSFAMCEYAWTNCKVPAKIYRKYHVQVNDKNKIHPTQKPIELYDWILANYTTEGMKILDTHLGSGSSRISAYFNKMNFVGFEIDEDYVKASDKRFKDAISQQRLF
jgi:site-specific DNA-methyltransferase (adenine-specific)